MRSPVSQASTVECNRRRTITVDDNGSAVIWKYKVPGRLPDFVLSTVSSHFFLASGHMVCAANDVKPYDNLELLVSSLSIASFRSQTAHSGRMLAAVLEGDNKNRLENQFKALHS
jgi:hypothetical protein